MPEIISENIGTVQGTNGVKVKAEHTFLTAKSVLFDAVYMIRGSSKIESSTRMQPTSLMRHFHTISRLVRPVKASNGWK